MSENFSQLCSEFTGLLASKKPAPGGGGAAALCGALAAALCAMAGGLSADKKSCAANSDTIIELTAQAQEHRVRLLELIDEDAAAFAPLSRAYSVPKDAPDRKTIVSEASALACSAPLAILRECCEVTELLEQMLNVSHKLLISDVGCAAAICRSAIEAAAMNVYVNLPGIDDSEKAAEYRKFADEALEEYGVRAAAVASAVTEKLRSL